MTQSTGLSQEQRNMLWGTITLGVIGSTLYHGAILMRRISKKTTHQDINTALRERSSTWVPKDALQVVLKTLPAGEKERMQSFFWSTLRGGLTQDLAIKMICDTHPELFTLDHLTQYFDRSIVMALTPLLQLDLVDEYDAIHMMRDQAAKIDSGAGASADTKISLDDGHRHFDSEYGTTDLERLLNLRQQLPGKTMQAVLADPRIEKAFVTQSFITLKAAMLDAIKSGATAFKMPSSVNSQQVFRVPRCLNDLKANQSWLWPLYHLQITPPTYKPLGPSVSGIEGPEILPLEVLERTDLNRLNKTFSASVFIMIWTALNEAPAPNMRAELYILSMLSINIAMMYCAYLLIKTVLTR